MTNKAKNHKKQAGVLQTAWIVVASLALLGHACIDSIVLGLLGRITPSWVDKRVQTWTKRMLKLWRIHCKVYNPKNVKPKKGQPTIIMCNHSSLLDIPLSFYAFPDVSIRMLAKKELSQIPLMGGAMRASGFPIVDRKNRTKAVQNLKALHALLESGIVMWIAPEGTRSATGKLASFKKGGFITAIQTNAVIIPIGIRGAADIIPARTHKVFLGQTAEVHIGEPIDASKFTLENKEALIEQTHEAMKKLVGEAP